MPRALMTTAVLIMPHPETHGGADCVPVSKAETPVPATVLPSVQYDPRASAFVDPPTEAPLIAPCRPVATLRQRAERSLFELEATAQSMAAELGEQTPEGRLLACRWAAARALLLEVLEQHEPGPSERRAIGNPWDSMAERGLVGRLCQHHGWRTVTPGVLARAKGERNG
jgi:hypothetical protein